MRAVVTARKNYRLLIKNLELRGLRTAVGILSVVITSAAVTILLMSRK